VYLAAAHYRLRSPSCQSFILSTTLFNSFIFYSDDTWESGNGC